MSAALSNGAPNHSSTSKTASGGGGSRRASVSAAKMTSRNGAAAGTADGTLSTVPQSQSPSSLFDNATSAADIRATLAGLHDRDDALTTRLRELARSQSHQADLGRDLLRLDSLRATLGAQVIATRSISNTMLAAAADTAGGLASTVRALDLEKARVEATLRVVEQVSELKACVAGVVGSMGAPQDWEAAAGYLARASRIPDAIVASGFARAVVPTVEVPDPPQVTLEDARASLCGLFLREFERAARDSDDARVTRFFKLFPLIGRTDVGLDVYGRYVCQGVAESARNVFKDAAVTAPGGPASRRDGFFYANALAKLFTHISQIVEGHGGLVERHYGTGQMVKVIARLQKEADVQGGIVVDAWSDERGVDRKLTDVKSYPFSFLVQSYMASMPRPSGVDGITRTGTPRVNSPALGLDGADTNSPRHSEDEGGVNMKEIDGLLSEIAVMLSRWSLYSRFLGGKCRDPKAPEDAPLALPDVLTQSNLYRKVASRLTAPYNLMSTFFFRRSVEKAFQLEEMPSGLSLNMNRPITESNPPYIVSAVDDVMYIVNAVLQKCMSTLHREVVAGVVPPVGRILGNDFIGMIQRKMRDEYYPKPLVHGGFPPEDRIVAFIVLGNSVDMAIEYLARIVSNHMGVPVEEDGSGPSGGNAATSSNPAQRIPSPTAPAVLAHLREAFPFEHDAALVAQSLANLYGSFTATAGELQSAGVQELFNQVVKPRLRPILVDTFRDADYSVSDANELAAQLEQNGDDDYEDLETYLEQVPRRFAHGWDALMRPLARVMTPRTYATLAEHLTARYLASVLERRVWQYGGRLSAYGAIRLERDINGIVGAVARGSSNYGVREVFAKAAQVLMVANMEEDEWEELSGAGGGGGGGAGAGEDGGDGDYGMVWLLSEDERRRARGLVRQAAAA